MSQVVQRKDNSKRRYNGECACVDGRDKNKKCEMRQEMKDEMTLSEETRYGTRWWMWWKNGLMVWTTRYERVRWHGPRI